MSQSNSRHRLTKEAILFFVLLLAGILLVPFSTYWIGSEVLGEYGGEGFSEFIGVLGGRLLGGDLAAWFLILSPYLGLQCLRLAWHALRGGSRPAGAAR